MTAPYSPYYPTWKDNASGNTAILAAALNTMEAGIARYSNVQLNGTAQNVRNTLNLTGGFTVTDDSANNRTTLNIPGGAITALSFDANMVMNITAPGTYQCNISGTTGNNDARIMLWEPRDDTIREVIVFAYISAATNTIYRVGPGSIAWDSGMGTYDSNTMPQWDVGPGSITVMRFLWMGMSYGWTGTMVASIPPYWSKPSATGNVTNTESLGWGGVNTQALNTDIYFMRNLSVTKQQWALNGLTQCFSAALRQLLRNNGLAWEIGSEFTTDGPRSANYRGSGGLDFGGFYVGSVGGGPIGTGPVSTMSYNAVNDSATAKGGVVHETCHAMDALYYGGANAHPGPGIGNGSEPDQISSHSTLQTLLHDCQTNGGPSGQFEWFAELERQRRLGDNGNPNSTPPTGSMAVQLGTGTTGGTPASRYTRFVNYMTSLSLV